MTTDLVSDMLTRIRNASLAKHSFTKVKYSKQNNEEEDINEEYKTDLSNDVDVINKYGAILGIDIVREWWQKEGQKAYTEDLFSLMRK